MVSENPVQQGDCLDMLALVPDHSASLVYLDPPFFTGKIHGSKNREGSKHYSFGDIWKHSEEYLNFLVVRLAACKKVMKNDASIFVHCDHNNVHLARKALDHIFDADNFRSEIIWHYKRWSNAKRGLLQQHQTILHYSIQDDFKWNPIMGEYSASTNVDQLMHKRTRDARGKAIYATDKEGNNTYASEKKGVPLGDVWDIPFLNPKAKERTGYPTQKPLLLLERIIELTTDKDDLVIDPFCGSGTTLVAAQLLKRKYWGSDISSDAVALTKQRLSCPIRTDSAVMRNGLETYANNCPWVEAHLMGFSYSRIQRNLGADALLKESIDGKAVFVRVQKEHEPLSQAISALSKAIKSKGNSSGIVIATSCDLFNINEANIKVLLSPAMQLQEHLKACVNDKKILRNKRA